MRLEGKNAFVTGADSGIGQAVDEAAYVTGVSYYVDGGFTLGAA